MSFHQPRLGYLVAAYFSASLLAGDSFARHNESITFFYLAFSSFFLVIAAAILVDFSKPRAFEITLNKKLSQTLLALGLAALFASSLSIGLLGLNYLFFTALPFTDAAVQRVVTRKELLVGGTALMTALVGSLFFWFRLRQRFLYGITESLAGVAVAAHRLSIEPGDSIPGDGAFYVAVLTAGVYLVVRGIDNMHQAVVAGDPVLARLRWLLRTAKAPRPDRAARFEDGRLRRNPKASWLRVKK
jgi:hypothetical protein